MALMDIGRGAPPGIGQRIAAAVATDGTAAHPVARALMDGASGSLSDIVHHLCTLHGKRPGLVDHAALAMRQSETGWANAAAVGFAAERSLLARIAVAAGPVPSTPGQRESEAAIAQQRNALETLSRSERAGCALGAAAALLLDWVAIRSVLDRRAAAEGLIVDRHAIPVAATIAMLDAAPENLRRAIGFGADQLVAQHRGIWTLLGARQSARLAADRLLTGQMVA